MVDKNKPLSEKEVICVEYLNGMKVFHKEHLKQAIKDFMMDCSEELESNELEIVERNKNKHFGEFKDE